jgi:hypothetical protein
MRATRFEGEKERTREKEAESEREGGREREIKRDRCSCVNSAEEEATRRR